MNIARTLAASIGILALTYSTTVGASFDKMNYPSESAQYQRPPLLAKHQVDVAVCAVRLLMLDKNLPASDLKDILYHTADYIKQGPVLNCPRAIEYVKSKKKKIQMP